MPSLCLHLPLVLTCLGADPPIWGFEGGLKFAIPPGGFREHEPHGLIRLGAPVLPDGRYALVNFIAIEPIVGEKRGLSELEFSRLDNRPGKRLWLDGEVTRADLPGGGERLTVPIAVERFDNGAHVRLVVEQRSDRPDEIAIRVHARPDSAPIESCILTATMGNLVRARRLWLADAVIDSRELFAGYRDIHFTKHEHFGLERLLRTPEGDALVAITTDEADPASVFPFPGTEIWHYGGRPVTQYWRKPAGEVVPGLQAIVNARFTYWQSRRPIPGGLAYENFELREPFRDGQVFIFGITAKTPTELGFTARESQSGR